MTIGSTLHPARWAALLAVGLPLVVALAASLTALAGNGSASRSLLRALRYLLAAEFIMLLIIAVLGARYEARSAARDRQLYAPPGRLVDVGGYRLHLDCAGEGGPTVVMDAGLVGSWLDWRRVQPEVARFTRVCAYDRGGYGWSDPSPRPRTPDVIAEELHTLLERAGEKPPFVLVGHSLGGLNVRAYAERYRDQVAGLVLVDSAHPAHPVEFSLRTRLWLAWMRWTAPLGWPRWSGGCGQGAPEVQGMKMATTCRAQFFQAYTQQWRAMPQYMEKARGLGALGNLPLVVVSRDPRVAAGDQDAEQRWRKWQEELAHVSSNATWVTADGSSHAVMRDRPDAVVEAVRGVVEAVGKK